jgi:amino acid permease
MICIIFYGWQSAIEFSEDFDGIDSFTQNHWIVVAALVVALICSVFGVLGALKYNSTLAFIAAGWFSLNTLLNIVTWDVIGALVMAVFAYPHIYFYQELSEDIMSKQKYQNEKYSICCV